MKQETKEIIKVGLNDGLKNRIAKIYDVLSTAGEDEREQRFRNGLNIAVKAYERACEIADELDVG